MTEWTNWIDHDFSGFPSHILKPGTLVEIELINCLHKPRGKAMFVVGEKDVTATDGIIVDNSPESEWGWVSPRQLECLSLGECLLRVGRYRYRKPDQVAKLKKIALDTAI